MAKILAIDTSTDACSVALSSGAEIIDRFEMAAQSHTRRILPMIDQLLSEAAVKVTELDAIGFSAGPGSFTGLRIGFGVVQGMAFAADIPVVPVSTLMAMADGYYLMASQRAEANHLPVLAALDARMNEVYWGLYGYAGESALPLCLSPDVVAGPARVAGDASLATLAPHIVGVGSGWAPGVLGDEDFADRVSERQLQLSPSALSVARIARIMFEQTGGQPVETAQPVYLRDTVSWKKRARIRSVP